MGQSLSLKDDNDFEGYARAIGIGIIVIGEQEVRYYNNTAIEHIILV